MSFRLWMRWSPCLLAFCLGLTACVPSSQSLSDEQRDPFFLEGKRRIKAMDYRGAIASFEKAIEVNPRHADAHYEIGFLYKEKEQDHAAAIYHLERFLKLRPESGNAEVVRGHIEDCKVELAKSVSLPPLPAGQQSQFDKLNAENRQLREEVERWRAYFASLNRPGPAMASHSAAAPGPTAVSGPVAVVPAGGERPASVPSPAPSPAARSHTVKRGDTMFGIARQYRISVQSLQAANPAVDPSRMQPGRTLVVPSP